MNYLVTGGSGFIGSHLTDALLGRGDSVTVLDDLSTGRPENLAGHPRLRLVRGSVLDELVVDELARQCDVIVHLAAAVGVPLIAERPLRSLTTNIQGAQIVLDAAHRYRRKIMLTSTCEIYGKNAGGPLDEDADRFLGPPGVSRWAYGTAKAMEEILATAYYRERGLPTIVTRLFNTAGPRQSPDQGMVVPRLVRQAVTGEPLTVYGDGTQSRCFAHVTDIAAALMLLLDEPLAVGQTFNVGAAEEVTIMELAKTILELSGSASAIELVSYHEAYGRGGQDVPRRVADCTRLRALTGWRPRRNLDDVLLDVINEVRAGTR